jgi:hypothetical protein
MLSLMCLLALGAFVAAILTLMGKCPITVPVFLLSVAELLRCLPIR